MIWRTVYLYIYLIVYLGHFLFTNLPQHINYNEFVVFYSFESVL